MKISTLIHRFVGRIRALPGALVVCMVVAFIFSANVFFDSQTLTPDQEAEAQLGESSGFVRLSMIPAPAGTPIRENLVRELSKLGSDIRVDLQFSDFPAPEVAKDLLVYSESDTYSAAQVAVRYELSSGRFPKSSGEVVVIDESPTVRSGDYIAVLGNKKALKVVGVGHGNFYRETRLLAGHGTWASLRRDGSGLSQLSGSLLAFLPPKDNTGTELQSLTTALIATSPESFAGVSKSDVAAQLKASTWDRSRVAGSADPRWTQASPMSFWVPAMTMLPLAVLIAFMAVARRTGAALKGLVRAGVGRRTAVASLASAIMVWCAAASLVGAVLGSLIGFAVARGGSESFGNPAPDILAPKSAVAAVLVGLVLGAAGGWLVLHKASRIGDGTKASNRWSDRLVQRSRDLRHVGIVLMAAATIWSWARMTTADESLWFSAFGIGLSFLVIPDLVRIATPWLPEKGLRSRLSARLLRGSLSRVTATVSLIALAMAICCGFLVSFYSYIAGEQAQQATHAVRDQVILDNDGAPALPVPSAVRQAVDSVPALAQADPIQIWYARAGSPSEWNDITFHFLGAETGFGLSNVQAFAELDDIERAFGTALLPQEKQSLMSGGGIAIDKRVVLNSRTVTLVDSDSPKRTFDVPAVRGTLVNDPISDAVALVMLKSSVEELGATPTPGAVVYTNVSAAEAAQAREALIEFGIHPENAWIYVEPDPIIPDFALVGSAIGLCIAMLLFTWSSTRAQVLAIRPWVNNLGRLGIKRSWARIAVLSQYAWLLIAGVAVGLLAGLLPVLAIHSRLPSLVILIPWRAIGVLTAGIIAAVVVAAVLALRALEDEGAAPSS